MPEITVRKDDLECDFCGQSDPTWVYPADDFSQQLDPARPNEHEIHMLGGWNACDVCYECIEANDRDSLLEHSIASFGISNDSSVYNSVKKRIRQIHDEFHFSRTGEAVKEEDYQDEEGYSPGVIKIKVDHND